MRRLITTFAEEAACRAARRALDEPGIPHKFVPAAPGYARVGAGALVIEEQARRDLAAATGADLLCSGWVEHRPARIEVPQTAPPEFEEDVFGRAAVMVLGACTTDGARIRIVAHISGDLTEVLPYLNARMPAACYNPDGPTLTYMDAYRMVSVYARRIAVAKADEIVDAWRVLEQVRRRANEVWARRSHIEPCHQRRARPPALEIFRRLPGTNCGECGEATCLAFAVKVHGGHLPASRCHPVFGGAYGHMREALEQVCSALGVTI